MDAFALRPSEALPHLVLSRLLASPAGEGGAHAGAAFTPAEDEEAEDAGPDDAAAEEDGPEGVALGDVFAPFALELLEVDAVGAEESSGEFVAGAEALDEVVETMRLGIAD